MVSVDGQNDNGLKKNKNQEVSTSGDNNGISTPNNTHRKVMSPMSICLSVCRSTNHGINAIFTLPKSIRVTGFARLWRVLET